MVAQREYDYGHTGLRVLVAIGILIPGLGAIGLGASGILLPKVGALVAVCVLGLLMVLASLPFVFGKSGVILREAELELYRGIGGRKRDVRALNAFSALELREQKVRAGNRRMLRYQIWLTGEGASQYLYEYADREQAEEEAESIAALTRIPLASA